MKHSSLKFQITKLQQAKLNTSVEVIAIVVLALFISAILPSLLVRYLYADQQLFEQPALLEYIPVVAFVIGTGYGLFAIILNTLRSRKISQLSKDLETEMLFADMDGCCGGNGGCGGCGGCGSSSTGTQDDWADMDSFEELDQMVDEVIAQNEAKKTTKKSAKGSSKSKTASKKKSSKK